MNRSMECPICLDPILSHSVLGRIRRCGHVYHEKCIVEWSSRSNLCPTCRLIFPCIDIVVRNLSSVIIHTVAVQNRVNVNDAIDSIPREFVLSLLDYQERSQNVLSERIDVSSGVCLICSSAQYSSASKPMATCIGCGAKFHHACLGRTNETAWFCPECDLDQEFPFTTSRRSASSRRNVYLPLRNHLILPNLENDAFENPVPLVRASNVVNGGVLLRREARALKNLTPDEAMSWEMFERARKGDADMAESTTGPEVVRRKKRPARSSRKNNRGEEQLSGVSCRERSLNENTTSRISSLIKQIQSKSNSDCTSSAEPILIDLTQDQPILKLLLEQKRVVQKCVRGYLMCFFDAKDPSKHWLKTEEQYIQVNKTISRKIYSDILKECDESDKLESFFCSPNEKLQLLVRNKVSEWLQTPLQ